MAMTPIQGPSIPITPPTAFTQVTGVAAGQPSFSDLMLESIGQVNEMQMNAEHAVEQLFTGGEANTAEVLTAVQKADLSFKLMMQIRNKLVQAYEEIKDIRI
jgi:flagellar hook-basal body complex protein FliE